MLLGLFVLATAAFAASLYALAGRADLLAVALALVGLLALRALTLAARVHEGSQG
jgi:hypothetical protein